MLGFLFRKNVDNEKTKTQSKEPIRKVYYLVLNKNTEAPLGIYSTLDKAKEYGQMATHHSCSVIEFRLDEKCKFLNNPIFENKD